MFSDKTHNMAQLCGSNVVSPTKPHLGLDELDLVPLISRQKSLRASKRASKSCIDVVVKKDAEEEDNEGPLSVASGIDQQLALKQSNNDSEVPTAFTSVLSLGETPVESTVVVPCPQEFPCHQDLGTPGDCKCQSIRFHTNIGSDQTTHTGRNADVSGPEKVHFDVCACDKSKMLSSVLAEEVENSDNRVLSSSGDGDNEFASVDMAASKANSNDVSYDDLDHIALKERRRMLRERKLSELAKHVVEATSVGMLEDRTYPCPGRIKEETQSVDVGSLVVGNRYKEISISNASDLSTISQNGSSDRITPGSSSEAKQYSEIRNYSLGTETTNSVNRMENCVKNWSSKRTSVTIACDGHSIPGSGGMHVSYLPNSVKVKVEPLENSDLHHSGKNLTSILSFNTRAVKSEMGIPNELHGDELDHIRLQDRKKQRTLGENRNLISSSKFACWSKTEHPSVLYNPIASESPNPIKVSHPRKRKKTATDSVETALEEDAPGLLQMLVEQGVSVNEIKLFGETESDDDLDETFSEDSFSELEAVMTKIFSQRESFLKFAPVRCTKGLKPSYCLACLFSLVEQSRYLLFRKWPVEWGWCRDLQSFIFVFKRHNRLVLERPEYGYATYFFELVDTTSTDWQVKRLVTAMKLTNFGRINLIEDKALSVGEDLSEGEAKVLMDFGWVPNTGLGTMLNYRDRVYHDRKSERDTSEWRTKIGKLLTDGLNGGTIVSTSVSASENIINCTGSDGPQIKLEL